MAEADDIIAFGVTIGIDPDDDSEEAQARLAEAWKHHCDQASREERVVERTFKQYSTEDLLRELRQRDDVVLASWSVEDIANEIEYHADHRGFNIDANADLIERSAAILKKLRDELESAMTDGSFEQVTAAAEEAVDSLIEGGWVKRQDGAEGETE
jgi:cytochrome oxidase Cu insertion factor (SCO1/SenC/PrrC family)